ncbi:Helicase associated domain protein [Streptomyces sp. NPDC001054]
MKATPLPAARTSPQRPVLRLRDYQEEAVAAITAGLGARGTRGQLHAACGSGKTIMGLAGALRTVGEEGLFVVTVPSVPLVAQTVATWRELAGMDSILAVCSDESVGGEPDSSVRATDIPAQVTTQSGEIAEWLRRRPARSLVVTTIYSAHRLGEALLATGASADVVIVDEAHHLTGTPSPTTSRVLSDEAFPAHRRLFLTATPRLNDAQAATTGALTMSDRDVFGPVLYRYSWSRAIREKHLEDYRIVVMGVAEGQLYDLLQDTERQHVTGPGGADIRTLAAQTVMAKAAVQYGLRRIIAFCPRVEAAREFTRSLNTTLRKLSPGEHPGPAHAQWVSGEMSHAQREGILDTLREPPASWSVVANVRCLSEGVDVPAVDAVVFTNPKNSQVDIMQAVGRALRRSPDGSGTATIIVPIVVPDSTEEIGDLDPGDFRTLWQVVRALRAHDESLGIDLDYQRANTVSGEERLPSKISVEMPPGTDNALLQELKALAVKQTTSSWWSGYGHAAIYQEQHGDLAVPSEYETVSGFHLGRWIINARQHWRKGWLSDERVAALERIGMVFDRTKERELPWRRLLDEMERYRAVHGDAAVPQSYVSPTGYALGSKINTTRQHTSVPGWVRESLDELGMIWNARDLEWQRLVEACMAYRAEHGHLNVPKTYVAADGYTLGARLHLRAQRAREGQLDDAELRTLEELGWLTHTEKGRADKSWNELLAACDRYVAVQGSLATVSVDYVDDTGYRLGDRIAYYRHLASTRGHVPEERRAALDARGMLWRVAPGRKLTDEEKDALRATTLPERGAHVVRLLDEQNVSRKATARLLDISETALLRKAEAARTSGRWPAADHDLTDEEAERVTAVSGTEQGAVITHLIDHEDVTLSSVARLLGMAQSSLPARLKEYATLGTWTVPPRPLTARESARLTSLAGEAQGATAVHLLAQGVKRRCIADALGLDPSSLRNRIEQYEAGRGWHTPPRDLTAQEAAHLTALTGTEQGSMVVRLQEEQNVRRESIAKALGATTNALTARVQVFRTDGRWPTPRARKATPAEADRLTSLTGTDQGAEIVRLLDEENVTLPSIAPALGLTTPGLQSRVNRFRARGAWPTPTRALTAEETTHLLSLTGPEQGRLVLSLREKGVPWVSLADVLGLHVTTLTYRCKNLPNSGHWPTSPHTLPAPRPSASESPTRASR